MGVNAGLAEAKCTGSCRRERLERAEEEGRTVPASERALELALAAAQAAADKKADDIVILDVADQLVITDAFLLASAPNERQVLSIVDAIEERLVGLPEKAKPVRREGERSGRWVLLDYVDIVVHVQHSEEREFYALDRLWKDCPRVPFVDRDLAGHDVA
jgi:ribosome-associated protein